MKKTVAVVLSLIVLFLFSTITHAHSPEIQNGITYLYSAQNPDGDWNSQNIGTDTLPTTTTVLNTLKLLGEAGSSNYTSAITWLQNQDLETTEDLARRIYSLSNGGDDHDKLTSYFDTLNIAWGGHDRYLPSALDTALALIALKEINSDFSVTINLNVNPDIPLPPGSEPTGTGSVAHNLFSIASTYFTENQNEDGGWGFTGDDDSEVYVSALVLRTLSRFASEYFMKDEINNAAAFLLTHQNTDGGFGQGESTVYETGLCVEALVACGINIPSPDTTKQYLLNSQSSNGSWNDDPYDTALALRALAVLKPNLTLSASDISFSTPMPKIGEIVDITASIQNQGFETAENIVVRFFQGDPAAGGIQLDSDQTISVISPGGTVQVSVSAAFDDTGGKTIFVQIDSEGVILETNEDDNQAAVRIWIATEPDLAISTNDIVPSTYTPAPGTPFVLNYAIRNLGETEVVAFTALLYDGDPASGGMILETINIPGLAGVSAKQGTVAVTLEQTGSRVLYLVADADDLIVETSEENNTAVITLQVGGAQGMADPAIMDSDVLITPSRPTVGETVTISATIRNQGTEPAENLEVEFFNGAPDSGGTLLYSETIPTLSAQEEKTLNTDWTVPAGVHYLYVIIDRENQIIEFSESNNQATITVMPDMVDITVSATDLVFIPAYPVVGDSVWLEVTLHNRGILETGPFSVGIFDGNPQDGGVLLESIPISNIEGDGTKKITHGFVAEAKTYRFFVVADTDDQVTEYSEENNLAVRSIVVKNEGETYGPDLVPLEFELSEDTITDSQTLEITGTASVTFQNRGDEKIETPFSILVFEDVNQDGLYTAGVDTALGSADTAQPLWPNGAFAVEVPLTGQVRFLHAPLSVLIDSGDGIAEQKEDNNILVSGSDCEVRPVNPIQPLVEWRWQPEQIPHPAVGIIYNPPAIINLTDDNGDGRIDENDTPDIVFNMIHEDYGKYLQYHGQLRAFSGDDGTEIFKIYDETMPTNWVAGIATGDIDKDGYSEIIATKRQLSIVGNRESFMAFAHDGTIKWENSAQLEAWYEANPFVPVTASWQNIPVISDLDGDGQTEILSYPFDIFNSDGTVNSLSLGKIAAVHHSNQSLIVADLDLDNQNEIISGAEVFSLDGTYKWPNNEMTFVNGYTAIGNLDQDVYPEIAIVQSNPYIGICLYVLEHDGRIKWGPIHILEIEDKPIWYQLQYPIIADFDGDGLAEIGVRVCTALYIISFAGEIESVIGITGDTTYQSSRNHPTVFDLNGDGEPEVLIKSDAFFRIFNGKDGELLFEDPFGSLPYNVHGQGVLVADVDGDDQVEAIVYGYDKATGDAIRVYGSANNDWVNARGIWNEASYHVDNVNDDGTIPQHEAPSWLTHNTYRCQKPIEPGENPYLTPNLTVSYPRASQNGSDVNLTVRVGNGGAAQAPAGVIINFYQGAPDTGTLLGTAMTTRSLSPGEFQDITFLAGNVEEGLLEFSAVVDEEDIVTECREDDNLLSFEYTAQTGLPDLSVSQEDLVFSGGPFIEGSEALLQVTVHNVGGSESGLFEVKCYNGHPASGGILIGTSPSLSGLMPNGSEEHQFSIDTIGLAGTSVLYVAVDFENTITEENEENNMASAILQVDVPILPNLVVTAADIQVSPETPGQGEVVQLGVTVANRGIITGNIPVRIYLGDPDVDGVLISGETLYEPLDFGETASLEATIDTVLLEGNQEIFVTVDPANIITESAEYDNTATKSLFVQSSGLQATVILDKGVYSSEEDVNITVEASDTTGVARNLVVDLYIEDSAGGRIATIAQGEGQAIPAGETITFSGNWTTGSTLAGEYSVKATLFENGIMISKVAQAFIISPDDQLAVRVFSDKMNYGPQDTASLSGVVTSLSKNYIFEDLTVRVSVKDDIGSVLSTEEKTILSLMPGASFTLTALWTTGNYPNGNYDITLDILLEENVISTASASFEVLGSADSGIGLAGTITATPNPITRGEEEAISFTITNLGNEDINNLTVTVIIADAETGDVKQNINDGTNVPMASTVSLNATAATAGLAPKVYLAILRVSSDGFTEPKTLAGTSFLVEPGNLPPQAAPDQVTTDEDVPVIIPVVDNDVDENGDALVIDTVTQGALGYVGINTDNTVTYVPFANIHGTDSFTYGISDGNGGHDTATVSVTILSVNDPPAALAGGPYHGNETQSIIFDAGGSSDVDGDPLVYRWDFDNDGVWDTEGSSIPTSSFTWPDNYAGTIVVEVSDGAAISTATAEVVVNNLPPIADAGGPYTVGEGGSVTLSGSAIDPAGIADPLTFKWDLDGDGVFETASESPTFDALNVDGPAMINVTLQVTDDDGGFTTAESLVSVVNEAPTIDSLNIPIDPIDIADNVSVTASFSDACALDTHTWEIDWDDGSISSGTATSAGIEASHTYIEPGVYTVELMITDDDGGTATKLADQYVVLYDPDGGFVTGGGWFMSPEGAFVGDPTLTGKANFGFVSKYKQGQSTPSGNTEFQFKAGDINFHSSTYEWLVIANQKAIYKGIGTINGTGSFGFIISGIDEELTPSTDEDLFRIKIWDKDNDNVLIYDNQIDAEEDADPTTQIGGGNIKIHGD